MVVNSVRIGFAIFVLSFGTHAYTWSIGFKTPSATLRQARPLRPATANKHASHTNSSPQQNKGVSMIQIGHYNFRGLKNMYACVPKARSMI